MTKASPLFLAVVLFSTAGMYGCTQQKNGAASAKIRDMEARYTKLEEDYRAVVATSEANRKKLAQLEVQKELYQQGFFAAKQTVASASSTPLAATVLTTSYSQVLPSTQVLKAGCPYSISVTYTLQ